MFSVFSEKHAKYLLPTYLAIALLLAWQWVDLLKSREGWQRQQMIGLPLVVLVGFVIFYSIFEGKIFASRVQALPEISQLTSEHSDLPIYSLGQSDMRPVYCVGHPISRSQKMRSCRILQRMPCCL